MATYDITATMNLKNIISEAREVAKAVDEFADDLEHIEERYNKEDEEVEPCETNLQALQKMDAKELGLLLTDIEHYDDENHQWHSNLTPLLPFEDWEDWLNRRAIYGKG